jgi:hypothetical protein
VRAALAVLLLASSPAPAEPVLSIDVTAAAGEELGDAFGAAKALGATASSVSILWDEMEQEPGRYSPKDNWPALVNILFPWLGLDFTLTLSVVDTLEDRRPSDLRRRAWDDPLVAERFAVHAENMLLRLQSLRLVALAVGNEVDAHIVTDDDAAAYARFFGTARAHLKSLRPDLPVGVKLTFAGLTAHPERWRAVLDAADVVMVTYYPLAPDFSVRPASDVVGDIAQLVRIAAGKPLWIMEAGYPSAGCGSSEAAQADFAAALVAATRAEPDVALVSWTFLTDLSETDTARLAEYYRSSDDCFVRYLRSLGLRRHDGTEKPAAGLLAAAWQ